MKIKLFTITLLAGLALFFVGCNDEVEKTEITTDKPGATETETTETNATNTAPETVTDSIEPGDIAADPEKYIGKEVTIVGEVEKVLGPMAFLLDEEAVTGTKDVLVLSPKNPSLNLEEIDDEWLNDGVIVKGVVKRLVTSETEKELSWDLSTEIEVEYKDRPVVIASSIAKR